MGILIRVKNASFEAKAVSFIPPVADGLEYCNFFGTDVAKAVRNLAPNKPAAALAGTVTHNANSIICKAGANYLSTNVSDVASMTLIAVAKPLADTNSMIIGNYKTTRSTGASTFAKSLLFGPGNPSDGVVSTQFISARYDGSSGATIAANATLSAGATVGSWCALIGRSDEAAKTRTIQNKTTGTIATTAITDVADIGVGKLRIGSGYVTDAYGNDVEIAAAAIYSRALSDAEIDKVYAFLKGYYSRRGIAI